MIRKRLGIVLHVALSGVLLGVAGWLAFDWATNQPSGQLSGPVEAHRLVAVMSGLCAAMGALVAWGAVAWWRTGRRRYPIAVDLLTFVLASYALLPLIFVDVGLLLAILVLGPLCALAVVLAPRPPATGAFARRFLLVGGLLAVLVVALAIPLILAFAPA